MTLSPTSPKKCKAIFRCWRNESCGETWLYWREIAHYKKLIKIFCLGKSLKNFCLKIWFSLEMFYFRRKEILHFSSLVILFSVYFRFFFSLSVIPSLICHPKSLRSNFLQVVFLQASLNDYFYSNNYWFNWERQEPRAATIFF